MPFDPTTQADEATYEGHLDQEPMGSVLSQVIRHKVTGRLTIRDEQGQNHLFLMQHRRLEGLASGLAGRDKLPGGQVERHEQRDDARGARVAEGASEPGPVGGWEEDIQCGGSAGGLPIGQ